MVADVGAAHKCIQNSLVGLKMLSPAELNALWTEIMELLKLTSKLKASATSAINDYDQDYQEMLMAGQAAQQTTKPPPARA